ncbi:MAG: amidohydrolase [Anaerolineales bacterium]|nr:amidohydrolase [Anaerolineales bacterium]MDW8279174.1 amidohydrolase family protein [Anaerolineales bacterium]
MPDSLNADFLLAWAREAGHEYPLFDCHVHPFDVLTGDTAYQTSDSLPKLFSRPGSAYHPPAIMPENFDSAEIQREAVSERGLLLTSRFAYSHTGARIFDDHLALTGLSGALLLPVTRCPDRAEAMLATIQQMFDEPGRYFCACPYPVGMAREALYPFFYQMKETYGICAVKIHTNLVNLDPASPEGRETIEAVLEAAGSLGLSVIVHGGWTPGLQPAQAAQYGTLERLSCVDWSVSRAPVVIAHAGCYALCETEVTAALSLLNVLFEKFPNLLADVSNLGMGAVESVLRFSDRSRLLFGSDALYIPIWKAWLRFLHALYCVSPDPESDLIRIASINPRRCLSLPV